MFYGMQDRPLYTSLYRELARDKSMIFLAGPRQSGKTTFARQMADQEKDSLYFNYDLISDRRRFLKDPLFFQAMDRKGDAPPLLIFDEIHKHRDWRNYLKGVYDGFHRDYRFLILGSGRLDLYRKGGDSLAGRYFLFHMFPMTLAEFGRRKSTVPEILKNPECAVQSASPELREAWGALERFSGFPEPFTAGSQARFLRWSNTYLEQIIRGDLRDLTSIRNLDLVEQLTHLIPDRIGSPLSMDSLARDLETSPATVKQWLLALDNVFLGFRLSPWSRSIRRALTKERKFYLMNPAGISDPGARFENLVALELWRAVHHWSELGLGAFTLHYVRNKEKEEVDFLIARDRKPALLIECKLSGDNIPKSLLRFQTQLEVPAILAVQEQGVFRKLKLNERPVLVIEASRWLAGLP